MMMNVSVLSEIIQDKFQVYRFLQQYHLVHHSRKCPNCNTVCVPADMYKCRCLNCRTTYTLLNDTIFDKSNLEFGKVLKLLYYWSQGQLSEETVANEVMVSRQTVNRWFQKFSDHLYEKMGRHNQIKVGGLGCRVQMDETAFTKRKYNCGRMPATNDPEGKQLWIVGGLCEETKEFFAVVVNKRDKSTLKKIIEENVESGTTIITDSWSGYNFLDSPSYTRYSHSTVNHSTHFVNPDTGDHTQNIEREWRTLKTKKKRQNGVRTAYLGRYLAEYSWRRTIKLANKNAFVEALLMFRILS